MRIAIAVALLSLVLALNAAAEDDPTSDFDYLLGDWTFTAVSKQWGKFDGRWSAVKLAGGQILDEYRVIDNDGKTVYMTTTLRNYNKAKKVWDLVGADEGGGLRDFGTARRSGAEMHLEQTFGASSDKPTLSRIRYHDILPDSFSWVSDRSDDGGKTWKKDFQTIQARRIGPRRELPALAGNVK